MPQDTHARMQTWTCQRCGAQCERRPKKGTFPKWCGPVCAKRAEEQRVAERNRKLCANCGERVVASDRRTRTCSRRCAQKPGVPRKAGGVQD